MSEKETKAEEQKTKTCKLAIVSLSTCIIGGLCWLLLCILMLIIIFLFLLVKTHIITDISIGYVDWLFETTAVLILVMFFSAAIFGALALIRIKMSKGKLVGTTAAIIGFGVGVTITLSGMFLLCWMIVAFLFDDF